MYRIYKITNIISGKSYIGFTSHNILKRLNEHFKDSKRNKSKSLLYKAMQKYDRENFIIEEVFCHEDQNYTHNIMEPYFINYFDTMSPRGYNLQPGGGGKKSFIYSVDIYDNDLRMVLQSISIRKAAEFLKSQYGIVRGACLSARNGHASQVKNHYVCFASETPRKKNYDFLRKRNAEMALKQIGRKRPNHSKLMAENNPNMDHKIYNFIHDTGLSFTGTRNELIKAFPKHKINTGGLGFVISGSYKSHHGWSIQISAQ